MTTATIIATALRLVTRAIAERRAVLLRRHLIAGVWFAEMTIGALVMADEGPRIAELRSRWKERSEAIHSLSVQAVATTIISKNAVEISRQTASEMKFAIDPMARFTINDDGSAISRDSVYFVLAGARSRVQYGDERRVGSYRYTTVTDGQFLKAFHPVGGESDGTRYPTGYVYDASTEPARPNSDQWPLLWYLVGPVECCARVSGRTCEARHAGDADVDGDPCQRISIDGPRSNQTMEFLISNTRAYHVLRMTHVTKGRARVQMDCTYTLNADRQWVLDGWTSTTLRANDVADTITRVDVQHFELNPAIDGTAFMFTFPSGTVVSDYRKSAKKGRTGSYDYLVRANGSERRIMWSEFATNYDTLVATEPGAGAVPSGAGSAPSSAASRPVIRQWLWGAVAVCIVCCAALCGYKLLRRRAGGRRTAPE